MFGCSELVNKLFPLNFSIEKDLRVGTVSPRLAELATSLRPGSHLAESFELLRPRLTLEFEQLARNSNVGYAFKGREVELTLQGQVVEVTAGQELLFVGGPVVQEMADLRPLRLKLTDFAPHDARLDLLLVVAARDAALRDANQLNARLQDLNAQSEERARALASEQERSVGYQRELEERLATIEIQRTAIRELSTPIIEVWEGILCLPVVGVLDSTRSAEMTEALLDAVVKKKAGCAIIDITGIQVMDTGTADHFLRMARAVKLLGANCLLSGINPAIAQTLIHMGVELAGITTFRSVRSALQYWLRNDLRRER